VIPPDASAAFVANVEDVLEVYQGPHDPQHPLVCLDETSKQLIIETRAPIPAKGKACSRPPNFQSKPLHRGSGICIKPRQFGPSLAKPGQGYCRRRPAREPDPARS
jgi:hypothetical protein